MGFFSGMQAAKAVKTLKAGGKACLSYELVSNLIINLFSAKRTLSKQEFDAVYSLYRTYQMDTAKAYVGMAEYEEMILQVLKRLDQIAPYETFGAGHEIALKPLLEKVRRGSE